MFLRSITWTVHLFYLSVKANYFICVQKIDRLALLTLKFGIRKKIKFKIWSYEIFYKINITTTVNEKCCSRSKKLFDNTYFRKKRNIKKKE